MTFDIVVRGGYVADGAGNPLFRTDVGVCGDRIAALGRLPDGRTTVDASGRVYILSLPYHTQLYPEIQLSFNYG